MIEFFHNELGQVIAGVRIQFDLLVVIHEDTATTIDIRPVAGCTPREPVWEGEELRTKLLQWRNVLREKNRLGVEAYFNGAR